MMKLIKSVNAQSWAILGAVLLASVFVFMPEMATAAGLQQVEGKAEEYSNLLYGILGAAAVGFIVVEVMLWWLKKREFSDIMMDAVKVGIGGAAIVLAKWAWDVFK